MRIIVTWRNDAELEALFDQLCELEGFNTQQKDRISKAMDCAYTCGRADSSKETGMLIDQLVEKARGIK